MTSQRSRREGIRQIIEQSPHLRTGLQSAQRRIVVFVEMLRKVWPAARPESTLFGLFSATRKLNNLRNSGFDGQFAELTEQFPLEIDAFAESWEEFYGEPFPHSREDTQRLLVRSGFSPEFAMRENWALVDVLPGVEGYLLRLLDQQNKTTRRSRSSKNPRRRLETATRFEQHWNRWKSRYALLVPRILQGDKVAFAKLRDLFGPTALARRFAKADGSGDDRKEIARIKTAIQGLELYQQHIKPLMQPAPCLPEEFNSDECPENDEIIRNMMWQIEREQS